MLQLVVLGTQASSARRLGTSESYLLPVFCLSTSAVSVVCTVADCLRRKTEAASVSARLPCGRAWQRSVLGLFLVELQNLSQPRLLKRDRSCSSDQPTSAHECLAVHSHAILNLA